MDLEAFGGQLKEKLSNPLPGATAHEALRATSVGNIRPSFYHRVPARPGSVLILLYPDQGSIKIPLTKRADYAGTHGGQISLPGGKREPNEDDITNALRESEEEIGLNSANVEVLGKLSQFFVIPSNYIVTPVVAIARQRPLLEADNIETIRIIECDLAELVADDAIRETEIVAAGEFRMLAPHFKVQGEIVWGATAMMLNEFRLIVREILAEDENIH